jgi:hypothetical protein
MRCVAGNHLQVTRVTLQVRSLPAARQKQVPRAEKLRSEMTNFSSGTATEFSRALRLLSYALRKVAFPAGKRVTSADKLVTNL